MKIMKHVFLMKHLISLKTALLYLIDIKSCNLYGSTIRCFNIFYFYEHAIFKHMTNSSSPLPYINTFFYNCKAIKRTTCKIDKNIFKNFFIQL